MAEAYRIRRCVSGCDAAEIHALMCELAAFERQPEAVKLSVEDLRRDGFERDNPLFYASLAEYEEHGVWKSAGLVLWYYSYSSWVGRTFYLHDCKFPLIHPLYGRRHS